MIRRKQKYIVSESWWQHTTLHASVNTTMLMDKCLNKGGIKSLPETTCPNFHCIVGEERADVWVSHLPQTQCSSTSPLQLRPHQSRNFLCSKNQRENECRTATAVTAFPSVISLSAVGKADRVGWRDLRKDEGWDVKSGNAAACTRRLWHAQQAAPISSLGRRQRANPTAATERKRQ